MREYDLANLSLYTLESHGYGTCALILMSELYLVETIFSKCSRSFQSSGSKNPNRRYRMIYTTPEIPAAKRTLRGYNIWGNEEMIESIHDGRDSDRSGQMLYVICLSVREGEISFLNIIE